MTTLPTHECYPSRAARTLKVTDGSFCSFLLPHYLTEDFSTPFLLQTVTKIMHDKRNLMVPLIGKGDVIKFMG